LFIISISLFKYVPKLGEIYKEQVKLVKDCVQFFIMFGVNVLHQCHCIYTWNTSILKFVNSVKMSNFCCLFLLEKAAK